MAGVPREGGLRKEWSSKGTLLLTHSVLSLLYQLFPSPECMQNLMNKYFPFCVEGSARTMNMIWWICKYRISLWGKLGETLLGVILRRNAAQHIVCEWVLVINFTLIYCLDIWLQSPLAALFSVIRRIYSIDVNSPTLIFFLNLVHSYNFTFY